MTRRSHGRPALPPDAKDEILHVLFANMEISGDEIAAILKRLCHNKWLIFDEK